MEVVGAVALPPSQPPGDLGWLERLSSFISANPTVAAVYVSFAATLVAMLGALVALRQSLTARKSLEVTRESLAEARAQREIATQSLAHVEKVARRERLRAFAPIVSPVLLGDLRYVVTSKDPDYSRSLLEQFEEESEKFDPKKRIELDLHGLNFQGEGHFWLGGSLILRNDGSTSAIVTPWHWNYELLSESSAHQFDYDSFILIPGATVRLFWLKTYWIYDWMDQAVESYERTRTDVSNHDPKYCFKHLGVRTSEHFLSISSPAVPRLSDDFQVNYELLVLTDDRYRDRDRKGLYKVGRNPIRVTLEKRVRTYPPDDFDSERG